MSRIVSFQDVLRYLRTLYIAWSLVRRRVTRRLIRLQTTYNVLKYRKIWRNNDEIQFTGPERNRTGTGNKFNLIMHMHGTLQSQDPHPRFQFLYETRKNIHFIL